MKCEIFSRKKNTLGEWYKMVYLKSVAHIFPSLRQFVNTVKMFFSCREPFIDPNFDIFITVEILLSKCVAHRWKQLVVGKKSDGRTSQWSKVQVKSRRIEVKRQRSNLRPMEKSLFYGKVMSLDKTINFAEETNWILDNWEL